MANYCYHFRPEYASRVDASNKMFVQTQTLSLTYSINFRYVAANIEKKMIINKSEILTDLRRDQGQ